MSNKNHWQLPTIVMVSQWIILPLGIFIAYYLSEAQIALYPITYATYFSVCIFLSNLLKTRQQLYFPIVFATLFICSRISPLTALPDQRDLQIIAPFRIEEGSYIEQDFLLPVNDWRYQRALSNQNVELILRFLGNIDLEYASIYLNGVSLGKPSEILLKAQANYYNPSITDYYFRAPKNLLIGEKLTMTIRARRQFDLAYSSGIHPLPVTPHARLITSEGNAEDLSARYYHRRFRFQIAFYLTNNQYLTQTGEPLIIGSLH